MTPAEALDILDALASRAPASRRDHHAALRAREVLEALIAPAEEPSKDGDAPPHG